MNSLNNPPENSSLSQETWQKASFKIEEDMRRSGHASVRIDQYLVIVGGWRGSSTRNNASLVVFDMQKETCTQVEISGRNPSPLLDHSACYWKDNQIIVYGGQGYGMNSPLSSEVGIITLSFTEPSLKAERRTIKTDSNIPRTKHTAHIYKNQMIVIGGSSPTEWIPQIDIHILNLDDFTWTQAIKSPEGLKVLYKSILYGNEIYVFGQKTDHSRVFLSLNLDTLSWKELPVAETRESSLYPAAIQEHEGKIYLVAEDDYGGLLFQSFDINQEKWSVLPNQGLFAKGQFSSNVHNNHLFLYGGEGQKYCASNELWSFRLGDSAEIQKDSMKEQPKEENIMKKFLREAPYSDVTFEVESESIPAHKWWLCKKSKYFANMFSSGMIEAKSSKIVVTDMTAKTFRSFLEYLYSDDIQLDINMAQDLLTQADKYSVPELKGLCEQFLLSHIEPNNYTLLANLSELLEANKLRDTVRDYIAKNIKMLKSRKDFEEISMDMLRDVIVKITVR